MIKLLLRWPRSPQTPCCCSTTALENSVRVSWKVWKHSETWKCHCAKTMWSVWRERRITWSDRLQETFATLLCIERYLNIFEHRLMVLYWDIRWLETLLLWSKQRPFSRFADDCRRSEKRDKEEIVSLYTFWTLFWKNRQAISPLLLDAPCRYTQDLWGIILGTVCTEVWCYPCVL